MDVDLDDAKAAESNREQERKTTRQENSAFGRCINSKYRTMGIAVTGLGLAIAACLAGFAVFARDIPIPEENCQNEHLKFVSVLFRHGARTPVTTYNSDPYKHYDWPDGIGALTNVGKQQMFHLGEKFRARYDGFLPAIFRDDDLYVLSSDLPRALMSAGALLAGLYPPAPSQRWHPDLSWQPVPVHSIPRDLDAMLAAKRKCPAYLDLFEKAKESDEIRKLDEKYSDIYDHLTTHCNQTINSLIPLELLYSTFQVQQENGLELPEWTKDVFPDRMREPTAEGLAMFTFNKAMKRIKGGPLLGEIFSNMNLKHKGKLLPNRKMFLYSAHDLTIVGLWRTLGFEEHLIPGYGAAIIVELHSLPDASDSEVKLLYHNSSSHDAHPIFMPNCNVPCTLTQFKELTNDLVPLDWDEECGNK